MKQWRPPGLAQLGTLDVFGEVALERVVARHLVELVALLVEPHPRPALLVEEVGHVHAAGRGVAGEGEDHHANQGTIPQPRDSVILDRAQQLACVKTRALLRFS